MELNTFSFFSFYYWYFVSIILIDSILFLIIVYLLWIIDVFFSIYNWKSKINIIFAIDIVYLNSLTHYTMLIYKKMHFWRFKVGCWVNICISNNNSKFVVPSINRIIINNKFITFNTLNTLRWKINKFFSI